MEEISMCSGRSILALALLLGSVAHAEIPKRIDCGDPCVVFNSIGGEFEGHMRQAREFQKRLTRIIIRGKCESMCTVVVDLNRERVCVTPEAILGFHKGTTRWDDGMAMRFDFIYSQDIARWISASGGLPMRGMLEMKWPTTNRFFRQCETGDLR
jgi:hypothetical protein